MACTGNASGYQVRSLLNGTDAQPGVCLFVLWFRRRRAYDGQVFLVFVALQESGKAMREPFRAEKWSGTSETLLPAVSALLAAAALAALAWNAMRAGRAPRPSDPATRSAVAEPGGGS
jgi:hypothetical protein